MDHLEISASQGPGDMMDGLDETGQQVHLGKKENQVLQGRSEKDQLAPQDKPGKREREGKRVSIIMSENNLFHYTYVDHIAIF